MSQKFTNNGFPRKLFIAGHTGRLSKLKLQKRLRLDRYQAQHGNPGWVLPPGRPAPTVKAAAAAL
jgi:hypothetical protein